MKQNMMTKQIKVTGISNVNTEQKYVLLSYDNEKNKSKQNRLRSN